MPHVGCRVDILARLRGSARVVVGAIRVEPTAVRRLRRVAANVVRTFVQRARVGIITLCVEVAAVGRGVVLTRRSHAMVLCADISVVAVSLLRTAALNGGVLATVVHALVLSTYVSVVLAEVLDSVAVDRVEHVLTLIVLAVVDSPVQAIVPGAVRRTAVGMLLAAALLSDQRDRDTGGTIFCLFIAVRIRAVVVVLAVVLFVAAVLPPLRRVPAFEVVTPVDGADIPIIA